MFDFKSIQTNKRFYMYAFVWRQEFERTLKSSGEYTDLSEDAIKEASNRAHVSTNEQLHNAAFDDSLSGTTAISVLLKVRSKYTESYTIDEECGGAQRKVLGYKNL